MSYGGGTVSVRGRATGGSGGVYQGQASDGGSVALIDSVSGETANLLSLAQNARGGNGASLFSGATVGAVAGSGGSASSTLDRVGNSGAFLVEVTADGGRGGDVWVTVKATEIATYPA